MRFRLLSFSAFLFALTFAAKAQLVGTNTFLQGAFVEIGVNANGSFGTSTAPAGYHPFPGPQLAEVYDQGHDGWAIGVPPMRGDYTYPGTPFEGWEVQVNGNRAQAFQSYTPGYNPTGGLTVTGAGPTGYTNVGGSARGYWAGTINSGGSTLNMKMETRVDTQGSAVVVTVWFYNPTASVVPGVYYLRTCDPDNDEAHGGVTYFSTNNTIIHQNEDATHRVDVQAKGTYYPADPTTMDLCTKDCRAKAFIYSSWWINSSQDLAAVYSGTATLLGTSTYTLNATQNGDVAIGLIYNIGNIPAFDSAVISYAYVFNGPNGIDSAGALPGPVLVVNGNPVYSFPDTLNGCSLPGVDSVPVTIRYGDEYDWTWGSWTWSPSTGLSATTGVHVYLHLDEIPGDVTYTVTGTDSGVYMNSCLNQQFVFTVHSCHQAYGNNPCEGQAIVLGMLGDSLGATYFWYGPAGFTSYLHNPVIFPATMADTGVYHVVRTIAGVNDTDFVHVMVHPLPVVTVSSNIPLCGPIVDPLLLTVNLDSVGETFQWTGPSGFTSSLQTPSVTPFDSSLAGTYAVAGTSVWGCTAYGSIDIFPGVQPHFSYAIHRGCTSDTVLFFDNTYNANSYMWNFGDNDSLALRDVSHVYAAPASAPFTVSLRGSNAHCSATWDTVVDTRHSVTSKFWPSPDTFCLGTPVTFLDSSSTVVGDHTVPSDTGLLVSFAWDYGNGVTDTGRTPAPYTYDACGLFTASLTVTDSIGCTSTSVQPVYVIQLSVTSFKDTTLCISMPLPMTNEVSVCPSGFSVTKQFVWTQNTPNLSDTSIQHPTLSGFGLFVDTLTISYPGIPGPLGSTGCAIRDTVTVHAVLGAVLSSVTASATIAYGNSIQLNADNEVIYYWKPNDGSLNNPNINDPIATPSVTTVYTVYGLDVNGCLDSAFVTIHVDSTSPGDMPGAFSPNNDGLNDVFRPVGEKFAKMVEFRVYNRWGEEIFFTNDRTKGWDGTFHGIPQDIGVYNYVIIVGSPGGQNIVYKGNVTLIR